MTMIQSYPSQLNDRLIRLYNSLSEEVKEEGFDKVIMTELEETEAIKIVRSALAYYDLRRKGVAQALGVTQGIFSKVMNLKLDEVAKKQRRMLLAKLIEMLPVLNEYKSRTLWPYPELDRRLMTQRAYNSED